MILRTLSLKYAELGADFLELVNFSKNNLLLFTLLFF